jgi:hypothetical protein
MAHERNKIENPSKNRVKGASSLAGAKSQGNVRGTLTGRELSTLTKPQAQVSVVGQRPATQNTTTTIPTA